MNTKRTLALILALALTLALCPAAFALSDGDIAVTVDTITYSTDKAQILIVVENKSATETVKLTSATPAGFALMKTKLTEGSGIVGTASIAPGGSLTMALMPQYDTTKSGTLVDKIALEFINMGNSADTLTKEINVKIEVPSITGSIPTPDPNATDTNPAPFRVSSIDPNGKTVATASGNSGDKITVRVPLLCLVSGPITNITMTPKLSANLEEFPFDITQVDYTLAYPGSVTAAHIIEFDYNFRIASKATAGVKKVDFTISYYKGWGSNASDDDKFTMDVSIYVNIVKGYTEGPTGTGAPVSAPKLILEGYSLSADKIYAGDTFDVAFTLRNTSTEEDVQNIQIKVEDTAEIGKVIPADNGSNTLYIPKIKKGESETVTISLQTAADTEAKAYKLNLGFSYEGAKSLTTYTPNENITVTIMQKIRLKFDDPVVDGEAMPGQSCPIYFSMYNMGKAAIYNCIVSVEGDGLEMEETYFGGTVGAGSTMRADFNIITNTPGQIEGNILVTYEDSLGEQMEERLPLSLYVMEDSAGDMPGMEDPMMDPGMMEDPSMATGAGTSGSLWIWIAIGVAVAAGVVVLIIVLKKKREKSLEDV